MNHVNLEEVWQRSNDEFVGVFSKDDLLAIVQRATRVIERSLGDAMETAVAYTQRGLALLQLQQPAAAKQDFEQLFQSFLYGIPGGELMAWQLSAHALKHGNRTFAAEVCTKGMEFWPNCKVDFLLCRAHCYLTDSDFERSLEDTRAARTEANELGVAYQTARVMELFNLWRLLRNQETATVGLAVQCLENYDWVRSNKNLSTSQQAVCELALAAGWWLAGLFDHRRDSLLLSEKSDCWMGFFAICELQHDAAYLNDFNGVISTARECFERFTIMPKAVAFGRIPRFNGSIIIADFNQQTMHEKLLCEVAERLAVVCDNKERCAMARRIWRLIANSKEAPLRLKEMVSEQNIEQYQRIRSEGEKKIESFSIDESHLRADACQEKKSQ